MISISPWICDAFVSQRTPSCYAAGTHEGEVIEPLVARGIRLVQLVENGAAGLEGEQIEQVLQGGRGGRREDESECGRVNVASVLPD